MATFKMVFKLDNAAYRHMDDDDLLEFPQIAADIHVVADKVFDGNTHGKIVDANGNVVGQWVIRGDD